MRKDYEYVDKATSMCLTTTKKGEDVLNKLSDEEIENSVKPTTAALIIVQNDYVRVPDGSINEWYDALKKTCKDKGYKLDLTFSDFQLLIAEGLVGLRKVVWD